MCVGECKRESKNFVVQCAWILHTFECDISWMESATLDLHSIIENSLHYLCHVWQAILI